MKRKVVSIRKLFTLFFLVILTLNFAQYASLKLNLSPIASEALQTATVPSPNLNYVAYGLYVNWTNAGDFNDWHMLGASFTSWTNTTGNLNAVEDNNDTGVIREARRNYLQTSTNYLTKSYLHVVLVLEPYLYLGWDAYNYIRISIFYTDGTSTLIVNETWYHSEGRSVDYWYNTTLTPNKYVNYITLKMRTEYATNDISIFDEKYYGFIPKVFDLDMAPRMPKCNNPASFYCTIKDTYMTALDIGSVVLNLIYDPTLKGHTEFMRVLWQTGCDYITNYTFDLSGDYRFFCSVGLNYWKDAITDSYIVAFHIYSQDDLVYPAEAKLTLWSPTGTSIPTNLKVYLGQSETFELYMPQINRTLPWQAYSANATGKFVSYYEEDNKILVNCQTNGIKAQILTQGGLYPNIEHFESFVFDIRVRAFLSTDQTILLGLNFWQADYALNTSSAYLNQWVQYIVPIPLFNWHVNYSSALAQICFYGSFRAEIKNIFVADYKNITAILTNANNVTTQYEVSTQLYSRINIFENNSYTAFANWNNYSSYLNNSYSNLYCQNNSNGVQLQSHTENRAANLNWNNVSTYKLETNFNVTNFQSANITIVSNQTVQLSITGNYLASYSFTSDTVGAKPNGWTINEQTGCTGRIAALRDGHKNVLECIDTNSANYIEAIQDFTAGQGNGAVEFWFNSSDTSKKISMALNGATYGCQFGVACSSGAGYFQALDHSTWHSLTSIKSNTWYHLRISFECAGGSYDGLSADHFNVYVNGTLLANNYGMTGDTATLTKIQIHDYIGAGQLVTFCFDAVDYSWASGYFTNRNLNNTYFASGVYTSKIYDLQTATYHYYQQFKFNRILGTNTALTTQYRTSANNVTWNSWTSGFTSNQTINANKARYYQFRVNLTSIGNFTFTSQCEYVNLTYTKANLLNYEINETNYFNFTYIYKPNLVNITLDATIEASRFIACNSYVVTSSGGSHSEENDYTYTWGNDTTYWACGGFEIAPNTVNAYIYLEINASQFSTSSIFRFYTKYKALWTTIQEANCFIYCFGNSTWIELDTATDDAIQYVDLNISDTSDFINATNFMKVRFASGMGSNPPWNVYKLYIYYLEIIDLSPLATLQLWNFASSTYTTLALNNNLTDYALTTDYFNNTHVKILFNITKTQYFVCTHNLTITICYFYYTNKTFYYYYTLNIATLYYFYYINVSSTLKDNTSVDFQYRTSNDNVTFGAWSSSLTINAFKNRYLQYRIDCNTLNSWNFSTFNSAKLYVQYRNITCYYISDLLQTAFTAPAFVKNVTLKFQVASPIDYLLNSSVEIYKFSTSTWQNLSSINQFCSFNVTSNYYNSSKYVKLQISIYSTQPFSLTYQQTELWVYGFKYNRTCYIQANFSFGNGFNLNVFYYHFDAPRNKVYLSFYNGSAWNLHSTYGAATNFTTITFPITNTAQLSKVRFKFVYYDAYLSDAVIVANISRYYFVAEYTYRLISDTNSPPTRQATDFLQFNTEMECLVLTDFYNTIIYKQWLNRTQNGYFIEVQLNYFEAYFANYVPNSTVTYSIRNRGLQINVSVPYGMIIPITLFTDDYIVTQYLEENKTTINIWDVVISRIKNRVYSYNLTIPTKQQGAPINYFQEYWYVWSILGVVVLVIGVRYVRNRKAKSIPQTEQTKPQTKQIKRKRKKLEKVDWIT